VVAAGKKLAVNYWPNFEAPALELRRLYAAGVLGDAVHVESFYGYNLAGEYGTAIKRDPDHWVHRMPGQALPERARSCAQQDHSVFAG